MSAMTPVFIAVLVSTVLSILTIIFSVRRLAAGQGLSTLACRIAWLIAIITFPFSWFLGFVVGGNFGGAIVSRIIEGVEISGVALIPIGIGLGIFLCTTFLSIGSAVIGFVVARYAAKIRMGSDTISNE